MRNYILLLTISCIVLSGCCKKVLIILGVSLVYNSAPEDSKVYVRTFNGTELLSEVLDMTSGKEPISCFLPIEIDQLTYYIVDVYEQSLENDSLIETKLYSDTISEVDFVTKGKCHKKRLKSVSFLHNGVRIIDERKIIIE